MTREIKFRAWDKKHNKMAQVYTLGLTGIEYTTICVDGELFSGCGKDNIDLMQFTGLYDKNGKEIYEGDIVKIKTKEWDCDKNKYFWKQQVVWIKCDNLGYCKAYFDLKADNKWDNGYSYEDWRDDWEENENKEVIGNVYQNKDLIN